MRSFTLYTPVSKLYYTNDFNGKISNGVGNSFILYFPNGKSRTYYFQQVNEYDYKNIESELIQYYLIGKLHLLTLLDALQLFDYEEIQTFKKSLQSDFKL